MFNPAANLNYNFREVGTEAKNYALPASILLQLRRKDSPGRMAAVDEPSVLRALCDRAPGYRPVAEGNSGNRLASRRRGFCNVCSATWGFGKYI
jgi:hypothetical protein